MRFVLTNNYIKFNKYIYKQIKGTAMGTPVAVCFANLFLAALENPLLKSISAGILLYHRYIDDIFAIFDSSTSAYNFLTAFNNLCPSIKLDSYTIGEEGIFLDLVISFNFVHNVMHHRIYQKTK